MKILIFGAPGSGKGTQSNIISEKLNILHVSTGDIIRNILKNDNDYKFSEIRRRVLSGMLIEDSMMLEILLSHMSTIDISKGFILDGFPRNVEQLEILLKHIDVDVYIELVIKDDFLVERISNRRISKTTGKTYNILCNPPPKEESVYIREDDKEELIRKRVSTYNENILLMRAKIKELGLLTSYFYIDCNNKSIEAVNNEILSVLA